MTFERSINRRLHEEHEATLSLWTRLEGALAGRGALDAPDTAALLRRCAAGLAEEVTRHFDFEEQVLFPRLAEAGEGDIAALLGEEHAAIREAAARFATLEARLHAGTLAAAEAQALRAVSLELAERLVSHVQKEELSLLPSLEDLIDEDADAELALAYATH
ncbi:MAG TPA: hemerythrin domain-containing protein [Burkholderiales bacterium]